MIVQDSDEADRVKCFWNRVLKHISRNHLCGAAISWRDRRDDLWEVEHGGFDLWKTRCCESSERPSAATDVQ